LFREQKKEEKSIFLLIILMIKLHIFEKIIPFQQ